MRVQKSTASSVRLWGLLIYSVNNSWLPPHSLCTLSVAWAEHITQISTMAMNTLNSLTNVFHSLDRARPWGPHVSAPIPNKAEKTMVLFTESPHKTPLRCRIILCKAELAQQPWQPQALIWWFFLLFVCLCSWLERVFVVWPLSFLFSGSSPSLL